MADVGARLREARERKGIPLKQVAAATKISLHSLEALERNDVARLPGGIFTRAFVRSYALEVGLDPDEILTEFLAQTGEQSSAGLGVPHALSTVHGLGPTSNVPAAVADEAVFESQQRMAAVVLKLVLVSLAVGMTILLFTPRNRAPETAAEPDPTGSGGVAAPMPGAPESGDVTRAAVEEPPAVGEPAQMAAAPSANVAPTDLPVAVANTPPPGPPAGDLAVAPPVRLEIEPTRECWVMLTADGQVVLSRVVAAGERETHTFRKSAVLHVGDAEACALSINGRPARTLGNPRQVRQIVLTRDNYHEFFP